jgi:hypothetical protein
MKSQLFLITLLALLLPSMGAATTATSSLFDHLYMPEVLEMELLTDLDALTDETQNREYQPAQIRFTNVTDFPAEWTLKVKARGKFRYRVCDFPPLKLNFKKGDLSDAGMPEFDTYKLVTHCLENEKEARDNIMREYLAYRLYNAITDQSFRVQLVRITYRDHFEPDRSEERWGILIESTAEMVQRLGGEEVELLNQPVEAFDARAEQQMSFFQHMIGNTDFDLRMVRNVKLVKMADGKLVPVPYDFDFSLLVNAPYALPNNNVGQYRLEDRVYLGFERTTEEIRYMQKFFELQRPNLEVLVRNATYVNRSNRQYVLGLLDDYFEDGGVTLEMNTAKLPAATR